MKNKSFDFSEKLIKLTEGKYFLKIISVVIAFFIWLAIIYYANPINSTDFSDIPVKIEYEGSVPYSNGLMMLVTDTNFTCKTSVEGGRTGLLTLSKDDISARLNLDSVAAPGTYDIPIDISVSKSNLTCKNVQPSSIRIQFVKVSTISLDVEVNYTNSLALGYEAVEESINPLKISVSGPADIIKTIDRAAINIDLEGSKQDIDKLYDVALYDAEGNPIELKYLTLSSPAVQAKIKVSYQREIPLTVTVINSNGGDESSYAEIECSPNAIIVRGKEELLDTLTSINIGTVDIADLRTNTITKKLILPNIEGVTYITGINEIEVTVNLKDAKTTTLSYSKKDMNDMFVFTNLPEGKTATIVSSNLSIKVRSNNIDKLTKRSLRFYVDLSVRDSMGKYKVNITNSEGTPVGVLGTYYVSVDLK